MRLWIKLLIVLMALAIGSWLIIVNTQQPPIAQVSTPIPTAAKELAPTPSPSAFPQETQTGVVAGTASNRELATVARVIDGDTVELSDGRKLRYIGIDTPETVDPNKPVQCIGPEATRKNRNLVEGKKIELEKDVSETDRLGRLLRYVYVNGVMVNDVLVREGFARSSKYPPDTKHQAQLDEAEQSARQNQWGIWSSICTQAAPTILDTPGVSSGVVSGEECVIKGNINSDNEKIYHLPGCGSYEKTKIDTARGEQYFCTEQEATAAGWRKAGNC